MQETHVLVKPDGVRRGLTGAVLDGLRADGLLAVPVGWVWLTDEAARHWYPEKLEEPDGPLTLRYLCEGPMAVLDVRGDDAIVRAHRTKRRLRRTLGGDERHNVVHCPETDAERDHERTVFAGLLRRREPRRPVGSFRPASLLWP
ncbi:nucleoside-diphosphate kinase [Micromonospora sp. NPDC023644]|uniref:nucleoside-diphosphate kinase n=1 Tax=Micromonospora sp. NPDC023644 TaxID=3154321 RepID=UPI0033F38128